MSMGDIASELRELKFRHRIFGGVDEDDVWVKLRTMQEGYRNIIEITQERCDALLLEREDEILQLQDTIDELRDRLQQYERAEENNGGGKNITAKRAAAAVQGHRTGKRKTKTGLCRKR